MGVQRHPEVLAHGPERFVTRVVVERQCADSGRQQDAAEVVLLRPRHLAHGLVELVDGDDGDPGVTTGVQRAEIGQPAVVSPRADRLQLPVGALGARAARRVERCRVVLRAVRKDDVPDDAVGLKLGDPPIGVVRAGPPTAQRRFRVVLLRHELGVEELRERFVELAPFLRSVFTELIEVRGIHVLREAALRVSCSRMAVSRDDRVPAHGSFPPIRQRPMIAQPNVTSRGHESPAVPWPGRSGTRRSTRPGNRGSHP